MTAKILGLDILRAEQAPTGYLAIYRYACGGARAIRAHAPADAELHAIADAQSRLFYRVHAIVRCWSLPGDDAAPRIVVDVVDPRGPGGFVDDYSLDSAIRVALRRLLARVSLYPTTAGA